MSCIAGSHFGQRFNYGAFRPGGWHNPTQVQHNQPDVYTGGRFGLFGGAQNSNGYGLELNRFPGHQQGRDGVLVFDFNRDGKFDQNEIRSSNEMLKAFSGDNDLNGDGRVTKKEKKRAKKLRKLYTKQYDTNRDGRLDTNELARAGAGVWIDRNRDGAAAQHETHSVFRVPSRDAYGRYTTQRIDSVNPQWGTTQMTSNSTYWGGRSPWGFMGAGYR
jgi:hypothetical protein